PSFTSFLLARLSGARTVVAFATQGHYGGANWSRWLADLEVPKPPAETPEWVTLMDLVRPLGIEGPYEPEFYVSPADNEWARARWQSFGFPADRPVIGLY